MSSTSGGEGLFAALKNLIATLLAIGKTRAELLVTEIEEEKFRLIDLVAKAFGAVILLALGLIMLVIWIAVAFWEQRVMVFGLFTGIFLLAGLSLVFALRRKAAQPSRLFKSSLAELDADLAQLKRSRYSEPREQRE